MVPAECDKHRLAESGGRRARPTHCVIRSALGAAVGAAVALGLLVYVVGSDLYVPVVSGAGIGTGRLIAWRGRSTGAAILCAVLSICTQVLAYWILDSPKGTSVAGVLFERLKIPFWMVLSATGCLIAFWLGRGVTTKSEGKR